MGSYVCARFGEMQKEDKFLAKFSKLYIIMFKHEPKDGSPSQIFN
jgi:hypothetical protein